MSKLSESQQKKFLEALETDQNERTEEQKKWWLASILPRGHTKAFMDRLKKEIVIYDKNRNRMIAQKERMRAKLDANKAAFK